MGKYLSHPTRSPDHEDFNGNDDQDINRIDDEITMQFISNKEVRFEFFEKKFFFIGFIPFSERKGYMALKSPLKNAKYVRPRQSDFLGL